MPRIRIKKRVSREILFTAEGAANFPSAVLQALACRTDLTGADLNGVYLPEVDLTGAAFRDADLAGATLTRAILRGTDLSGADLRHANLCDADFTGAALTRALLFETPLTGVLFSPEQLSQFGLEIPRVEALDCKVRAAVTTEGGRLDMGSWHESERTAPTCGSTHCRAGWAIHLAGKAGYALEDNVGPVTAGALIYLQSTGRHVPDFYAPNEEALDDIHRRADETQGLQP